MDFVLYLIVGIAAGTVGGLLGLGGGVIILPFLRFFIQLSAPFATGTTILAVFATGLGSTIKNHRINKKELKPLVPVFISSIISCILFSLFFVDLSKKPIWLDLMLGIFFIVIAIKMFYPIKRKKVEAQVDSTLTANYSRIKQILIGFFTGAFPGLLGFGAGTLLVPAFNLILKIPIKLAIAASLFTLFLCAFVSSLFKYCQGYMQIELALPLAIGTLIGSLLGSILQKKISSHSIKKFFALLLLYVAFKYLLTFYNAFL